MKLYEISTALESFLEEVAAGEIPEEAIFDTLDGLNGVFADKLDDCASAFKNINAEVEAIKGEIDSLKTRMDAKKKQAENLKDYIDRCMKQAAGGGKPEKLETARNVLNYRKVEKVSIEDAEQALNACKNAPAELDLIRIKEPEINAVALKKVLKSGLIVPGAELETTYSLSIK